VHAGDLDGAERALRQGLRSSPAELTLWECLADVVQARGDRSDEARFWRDATAALDTGAVGLLRERVAG
jgi:predicted Zn-dependent protease